jgi:hypothetical protein
MSGNGPFVVFSDEVHQIVSVDGSVPVEDCVL